MLEVARNSPFKAPTSKVQCEAAGSNNQALVPSRNIMAASTVAASKEVEFGSQEYFALCGLGGILSCGESHVMDM